MNFVSSSQFQEFIVVSVFDESICKLIMFDEPTWMKII